LRQLAEKYEEFGKEVYVNIIRSLHEGMMGQVIEGGEISAAFSILITNGTKQGYVLAPLLFCIFFAMMLLVAFRDCEVGVCPLPH